MATSHRYDNNSAEYYNAKEDSAIDDSMTAHFLFGIEDSIILC
ncbi:MAG: hypothetical protein AAGU75_09385 [Bacillota bacterium]